MSDQEDQSPSQQAGDEENLDTTNPSAAGNEDEIETADREEQEDAENPEATNDGANSAVDDEDETEPQEEEEKSVYSSSSAGRATTTTSGNKNVATDLDGTNVDRSMLSTAESGAAHDNASDEMLEGSPEKDGSLDGDNEEHRHDDEDEDDDDDFHRRDEEEDDDEDMDKLRDEFAEGDEDKGRGSRHRSGSSSQQKGIDASASIEDAVADFGKNTLSEATEYVVKKEAERAATLIQSHWRGYISRRKLDSANQEEEERVMRERKEQLLNTYRNALEDREKLLSQNLHLQKRLSTYVASAGRKGEGVGDRLGDDASGSGASGIAASSSSASKGGEDGEDSKMIQDNESKYKKYLNQLKEMTKEMNSQKRGNEASLGESMRGLEEKENKASEFILSATDFRKLTALKAKNSRTGKPLPPKLVEHFEKLQSKKDLEVKEVRIKYITLRNQKKNLDETISEKDEFSKGLHLIDFEQLKIENSTLNEKIEERNEDLMKLRKKATTTVHIMTHVKEKLQFVQVENQELKKQLADLENELSKHKDVLTQVKRERDALKTDNKVMQDNMPLVGSNDLLLDFESRKEQLVALRKTHEDLKERYDASMQRIKKYKRFLRGGSAGTMTVGSMAAAAAIAAGSSGYINRHMQTFNRTAGNNNNNNNNNFGRNQTITSR